MVKWIAVVSAFAIGILLVLRGSGELTTAEAVEDIAILAGWVIAVLVAVHQLSAARVENDRTRREELRIALQVEAFRQISDAAIKFSGEVSKVASKYNVAAFILSRPPILPITSIVRSTYDESLRDGIELTQAMSRFAFVIETYQIALADIHHLYLFIHFRVNDVAQQLNVLRRRLLDAPSLESEEARDVVNEESGRIGDALNTVILFVGDFRVEAMNSLVGPLFDRRVPRRQPLKASIKTLVELATPERVEAENQRRLVEAVVGA